MSMAASYGGFAWKDVPAGQLILRLAICLIVGIVLSPIMIKKLGVEHYGIWVLLFSLLEYMRVLDFGLVGIAREDHDDEDSQGEPAPGGNPLRGR